LLESAAGLYSFAILCFEDGKWIVGTKRSMRRSIVNEEGEQGKDTDKRDVGGHKDNAERTPYPD
jgi:hypothetical protein